MKMTPQQFSAFGQWLTKSKLTDTCPLCGQKKFVASDNILFLSDHADASAAQAMPIVYIRCDACLNMQFFPAVGVGVI